MKKLPVAGTIGSAYRFLYTTWGSLLGAAWLPLLLLGALLYSLAYSLFPHAWFAGDFSGADLTDTRKVLIPAAALLLTLFAGGWLTGSMVLARMIEHALGKQQQATFLYFSLKRDVWCILVPVALCDMLLLLLLPVSTAFMFHVANNLQSPQLETLAAAAACFVAIYPAVRLLFLAPAVAVNEHRLGLGRAWSLSKGNFWRALLVVLAIMLPVSVISLALQAAAAMGLEPRMPGTEVIVIHLAILLALLVLQRLVCIALFAGAMAHAYRALVPQQPAAGA